MVHHYFVNAVVISHEWWKLNEKFITFVPSLKWMNSYMYLLKNKVYLLIHKLLLQRHVHTLATQIIHWNIYPQGVQNSREKKKKKKSYWSSIKSITLAETYSSHSKNRHLCSVFRAIHRSSEQCSGANRENWQSEIKGKDTKRISRVREGRGGQRAVRSEVWCAQQGRMADVPFLQNDPYHPEAAADTELGALSRTIKRLWTGPAREAGAKTCYTVISRVCDSLGYITFRKWAGRPRMETRPDWVRMAP